MQSVVITALDQEARGVARLNGKAVFVEGALVGERVAIEIYRDKPSYALARLVEVEARSPSRVEPRCPHFGVCGGCSLQHMEPAAQVAVKQRVLEDTLWHIGRVRPGQLMAPIHGPVWAYRQRARLSVRDVPKKGGVLVGFHERKSSFVAELASCAVLPERISAALLELRALIARLSVRTRLPQIELAVGEGSDGPVDALVLRILAPLTADDERELAGLAGRHRFRILLQPEGPGSVRPLHPSECRLHYTLPDFDVRLEFGPTDFTQVNAAMNRALVRRAISLLDPVSGERVADFYCGVGNFTLPIARCGAEVVGIEGNPALVRQAQSNAAGNGLAGRVRFAAADLSAVTAASLAATAGSLDKALLDPPREGAIALVKALPPQGVARLLYVSCNPATLARDAAVLVHQHGYALRAAGVANMFPHTAHVESVALFER